ncbi:hypothetical protein ACHAWF_013030 [Thalassiosira exigua]
MFSEVYGFEDCADACIRDVPYNLIDSGDFQGIEFDCRHNECRCLYNEGTLSKRNSRVFDATDASESGYGEISGAERNRASNGIYCGNLAGAEFLEADEFLRADVTELWAATNYDGEHSAKESLSDEQDHSASFAEMDNGHNPAVDLDEERPAWDEARNMTKQGAEDTADWGKDVADKTKEWGQKTFDPDNIKNRTKSAADKTREWGEDVANKTKRWGEKTFGPDSSADSSGIASGPGKFFAATCGLLFALLI